MAAAGVLLKILLLITWTCVLCGYIEDTDIRNVCERQWTLVYANSAEGDAWAGSKKKLMDDVVSGKKIKVTLLDYAETYQIRVDNVNKRKDDVCAESLGHLAHNGTHVDEVSPKRYLLVCTSGHVSTLEDSGVQTTRQQAMYWYTQELSDKGRPVFSHYIDGSPARGSLQNLWSAARTMQLRGVMRDRGYVFPMQNVAVDVPTGVVTGQSIKHIGQSIKGGRIQFFAQPYLWFSSWSTTGRRDNSRWTVGAHTARGHNQDWVSLDWYADTCWRVIYTHDSTGFPEFGSARDLIEQVRAGHRVLLTIDDVTFEASNVRVSNEVVGAQVLDAVVRGGWTVPGKYDIRKNTAYHWILAHTSGTIRSYEYLVGTSSRKGSENIKAITWSVDTRPWRVVLKTEDQGRIVEGNPNLLRKAVEQGASIRINIGLDEKSGDFLTEPENVRIDEDMNIVYAQAMNHVSDKKSVTPDEYELQTSAFYWYLMISSEGDVRMSAWYVGKDERQYDERAPSANITWFANF
ncbi:uncharacterized protein [Littorina saxatilis]|uniref:uncharacterized protein n=1 Tax=Littorina saxatilis TaxID=31220 RepID=UPI0038B594ED